MYVRIAIKVLSNNPNYSVSPRNLWREVIKIGKYKTDLHYDYQMDIVCSLWNENLLEI